MKLKIENIKWSVKLDPNTGKLKLIIGKRKPVGFLKNLWLKIKSWFKKND